MKATATKGKVSSLCYFNVALLCGIGLEFENKYHSLSPLLSVSPLTALSPRTSVYAEAAVLLHLPLHKGEQLMSFSMLMALSLCVCCVC